MTENTQQATLTGSQVQLSDGNVLDLATITGRNYTQYNSDFSADEQTRAAALANFVQNYEQTLELTPTDMQAITNAAVGAIPEYIRLQQQGVEFLERSTDGGVQLLRTLVGQNPEVARMVQEASDNGVVNSVRATNTIGNALGEAYNGATGALDFIINTPGALLTYAETLGDAFAGGPSDAQSNAFATAYVLAEREATRRGSAEPEVTQRAANILDQVSAFVQAAFTQFAIVEQAVSFITNGDISGTGWQEAGEEVAARRAERAEAAGGTGFNATREYFLNKSRTTTTERATQTTALEIVSAAPEIAGIETSPVADILRQGGTYIRQDGKVATVERLQDNPTLESEVVRNPETGAERTRYDIANENNGLSNPLYDEDGDLNLFTAAGAAGVAAAGYRYRNAIGGAAMGTMRGATRMGTSLARGGVALATGAAEGGVQSAAAWAQRAGATAEQVAPLQRVGSSVGQGGRVATVLDDVAVAAGGTARGIQGTRLAALGRVGGRVATPIAAAVSIYDGVNMVDAIQEGDTRRAVGSGTAFGTALAGAGIGAAAGAGFFGVGALPGAVVGFMGGGIAAIFTKPAAEAAYDRRVASRQPTESTPTTVAGGTNGQTEAQRLAQARAQAAGVDLNAQGGATTTGPDGTPIVGGAPIVARLAAI